jgi:hypothetical protein
MELKEIEKKIREFLAGYPLQGPTDMKERREFAESIAKDFESYGIQMHDEGIEKVINHKPDFYIVGQRHITISEKTLLNLKLGKG